MSGGCVRVGATMAFVLVACGGRDLRLIESPNVSGAQTTLVAVERSGGLEVQARETHSTGALFETDVGEDGRMLASLVYFAEDLAELRLAVGPVTVRDPLDPLPSFIEAYQLLVDDDEVGAFERIERLQEPLASFLYPHPEGCTEVGRGGRTICVPNGCPGNCERDFCFDPPAPLETLDSPYAEDGVSTMREGGEVWLYFMTKRWTASSTGSQGRGDHARVRLSDAFTIDIDTLTQLDHFPVGLRSVSRPSLSRDGLEMVFSTLPPDAEVEHVYISHRDTLADPFERAGFAIAGLAAQPMMDPLIMLDPSIILLWSGVPDKLTLFRRGSTELGSVDFTPDISLTPTLSPDPVMRLGALASFARPNLSCDGWHLLLQRKFGEDVVPSTTLVVRHSPLELSRFEEVEDLRPPNGMRYTTWAEHPDCTAAYLSDGQRIYVARRRPCER